MPRLFASKYLTTCLIIITFYFLKKTHAQTDIEKIINNKIEIILESNEENLDAAELLDQYIEMVNNPVNINCKNLDNLLNLKIINKFQHYQLMIYLGHVKEIQSIQEIRLIEGFSEEDFNQLKHFIKVSKCTRPPIKLSKPRSELLSGYSKVIQKQVGYQKVDSDAFIKSPNKVYLGSPFKLYSRYNLKSGNLFKAVILAEKDPGEVLFKTYYKNDVQDLLNKKIQPIDFFSASIYAENLRFIKKLVIGDFQLQFGQGLTMWSSSSYGKSISTTNIQKYARGIIANTSSNENHFFRGIATSLILKSWELDLFYSSKKRDGNIISENEFSSLQNTGLHRTLNEIEDKNSVGEKIIGVHLNNTIKQFKLGFTLFKQAFNKTLIKSNQFYKQFYFSGNKNFCLGFDYQWAFNKLDIFGELTFSANKSKALFSGINFYPNPLTKFHIHYRNYSKSFQNFYANAISENTDAKNENGVYAGIDIEFHSKWILKAYTDFFFFPWLKSGVNSDSQGNEQLFNLEYKHSKNITISMRFKRQKKEYNQLNNDLRFDFLVPELKESWRLHFNFQISNSIGLQTRAEWQSYKFDPKKSSGYLVYQEMIYTSPNRLFRFSFRYVTFDIEDYDSRIYTYERDVLYAFSIPSFYGQGNRVYLMMSHQICNDLTIRLKFEQTKYKDRENIGSGLDLLEGSKKSELKFQLLLKF